MDQQRIADTFQITSDLSNLVLPPWDYSEHIVQRAATISRGLETQHYQVLALLHAPILRLRRGCYSLPKEFAICLVMGLFVNGIRRTMQERRLVTSLRALSWERGTHSVQTVKLAGIF
jgi:hypothetical protein